MLVTGSAKLQLGLYVFRQDYVAFSWFPGSWRTGGILVAMLASSISFIVTRNTRLRLVGTETKLGSTRSFGSFSIFLAVSASYINLLLLSGRDISRLLCADSPLHAGGPGTCT